MSELQIGLIGLGAAAIVGVMAYNSWQEYRQRKLAERVLNAEHADVLLDAVEESAEREGEHAGIVADAAPMPIAEAVVEDAVEARSEGRGERRGLRAGEERIEPVFRTDLDAHESERREPSLEASAPVASVVESPVVEQKTERSDKSVEHEPLHLLSPIIDYVVSLEATIAKPTSEILTAQQPELVAIGKGLHWIGYNESTREWEAISEDREREYRRLRVGLQLVDRRGPVAPGDLAIFHDAMRNLAEDWTAVADLPPCQPALDAAAKLDAFCASVDIQIGINVVASGAVFPGTKLRALAESAGMVIDAEGRFVRCDDEGKVLYILVNQETPGFSAEAMKTLSTRGVTFLLDVPRVAHGERVFAQMVELAKRFAEVLRGSLVDDNRRPLSDSALDPIRRQIAQYQTQMLAQNVPSGGPLAQRLFS
jgi:FtsZ-interacting cell division protein ZipA